MNQQLLYRRSQIQGWASTQNCRRLQTRVHVPIVTSGLVVHPINLPDGSKISKYRRSHILVARSRASELFEKRLTPPADQLKLYICHLSG
jgi:hypothetical protein